MITDINLFLVAIILFQSLVIVGIIVKGRHAKRATWISIKDRLPLIGDTVAFVVHCTQGDKSYNGRVLGGIYRGNQYGYEGFSVPGIEFAGSHWLPLPAPALPIGLHDTVWPRNKTGNNKDTCLRSNILQ